MTSDTVSKEVAVRIELGGRVVTIGGDMSTNVTVLAPAEFDRHIRLNLGRGKAVVYACELSEKYVDFNKGDISDPHAHGG